MSNSPHESKSMRGIISTFLMSFLLLFGNLEGWMFANGSYGASETAGFPFIAFGWGCFGGADGVSVSLLGIGGDLVFAAVAVRVTWLLTTLGPVRFWQAARVWGTQV